MVLELVDPCLYPIDFLDTRILRRGKVPLQGCSSIICEGDDNAYWEREILHGGPIIWAPYQYLPSDISWVDNKPKITTYINNLHPEYHSDLYKVFEEVIDATVPLWEECLFRRRDVFSPRIDLCSEGDKDFYIPEGVQYSPPDENINVGDEIETYRNTILYQDWFDDHKILRWPEPRANCPRQRRPDSKPNLKKDFPSGVQIIFKLTNIHLTPEKPVYSGKGWLVEGALNDRIVATALYYYEDENIMDSKVSFRQALDSESIRIIPPSNQYESLERYLGVMSDEEPFQKLGDVLTPEGRLLAFPNVFQHKMKPLELRDPTKPGYQKILTMFLVEPSLPVLSTAVVPPQQRDWWVSEVRKIRPFCSLPMEVFHIITSFVVGHPMDLEYARATRISIIHDRQWTNFDWEMEIGQDTFDFQEHRRTQEPGDVGLE